jgi:DNA end-binding protein Ku
MRPIWSGALSFGLVNIPIRVYSGSEEHQLEFDMLHKQDLSPIRYARICKLDGEEIPYQDIVKGFEYEKGEYIVIDEEDFKRANAQKTKTIDIKSFTFIESVDPIFYTKPYYLEPDKRASKAYSLLRDALKKSQKVAVATFVFRNKEHVGIVRPFENILILNQMRYQTEIRPFEELNIPEEKKDAKEVEIALALIEQLTEEFQPEKYRDTFTEEIASVIEAKLKGKKPARKGKEPVYTQANDLMRLLKKSVQTSLKTPTKKKERHPIHPRTKKESPSRRRRHA